MSTTQIPILTSSESPEDQWILNALASAVPWTIGIVITMFNLIGNFGNFNVIIATWRSKNLQSKHGWLLVILCAEHSMCLLFEFINVYFALSGVQITRRSCLLYLTPYIFISFLQSTTFIALAIDVLLSFTIVSRYQKWQTRGYCSLMAFSPCLLPIAFLIRLWSQISDEIIFLCNPPLSMDAKATNIWGGLITSINLLILMIYGYVYFYSHQIKKRTSDSKMAEKIMKSLTILVMVFCFSWVTCMGMVFLVDYFTNNEIIIMLVRSYATVDSSIITRNNWQWDLPINYQIAENVRSVLENSIRQTISFWENETCLTFQEGISADKTYMVFRTSSPGSCITKIGKAAGPIHPIEICSYHRSFGDINWLLVGALGAQDELRRADRDEYVNITEMLTKLRYSEMNDYGVGYDYGSVTHQRSNILDLLDVNYELTHGQRVRPSFADIKRINRAYCTSENYCPGSRPNVPCENGGYVDSKNCTICICPPGFNGRLCKGVQLGHSRCGTRALTANGPFQVVKANGAIDCYFVITAPTNKIIRFDVLNNTVTNLNSEICDLNYLEINYRSGFSLTGARFCNSTLPTINRSQTNKLVLIYKGRISHEGFELRYRVV